MLSKNYVTEVFKSIISLTISTHVFIYLFRDYAFSICTENFHITKKVRATRVSEDVYSFHDYNNCCM